jgi:hypothetical protein
MPDLSDLLVFAQNFTRPALDVCSGSKRDKKTCPPSRQLSPEAAMAIDSRAMVRVASCWAALAKETATSQAAKPPSSFFSPLATIEKLVNGTTQRFWIPSQRRQWRFDVTDIGHAGIGIPAFQREDGRWHSPPRHCQLASLKLIPNDRRRVVRKYAGERRHVAGSVSHGARQLADRLLALRQRVQVAQAESPARPGLCSKRSEASQGQ